MYESARAHMRPRDIRRRAYSLMRQCWKTLLIAAVLMSLLGWIESAVEAYGDHAGRQAYDAHMAAFIAENPPPEDEEARIEWAYFDAWLAQREAEDLYNGLYRPYEFAANAISFANILLSTIISVRLSKGLLTALRGGECTLHCLLSGWARFGTTCWLSLQRELRILGWALLPLLFHFTLDIFFGIYAGIISFFVMLLVAIWARLHYALAEVHLADDLDGSRTASDSLRLAVDDADAFTIRAMCGVVWPVIIPYCIIIAVGGLAIFVSISGMLVCLLNALCNLLIAVFQTPCFVCIYDEIRQRIRAAEEAVPLNEGLARARALATQSDGE